MWAHLVHRPIWGHRFKWMSTPIGLTKSSTWSKAPLYCLARMTQQLNFGRSQSKTSALFLRFNLENDVSILAALILSTQLTTIRTMWEQWHIPREVIASFPSPMMASWSSATWTSSILLPSITQTTIVNTTSTGEAIIYHFTRFEPLNNRNSRI